MIHRLALLLGGAAALGVLAFALTMGSSGAPLPNPANAAADALVPVANDLSAPQATGSPDKPKKDVQTIYVRPTHTPAVHHGGGTASAPQPTDKPRHPRTDNGGSQGDNGGSQTGGSQAGDDGHHSGGSNGDGAESGDD